MLTREDKETLIAMLSPQLGANPSTAVVAGFVGDQIAQDMPVVSQIRLLSSWIIDQALQQPTPNILIGIVETVDAGDGRMLSIVTLIGQLKNDPAPWQAWHDARQAGAARAGDPLQVEDGMPFIDRGTFRSLLPREGQSEFPTCVVVEGDEGAGKSYLFEYCKKVAADWKNFRVGRSEVKPGNARGFSAFVAASEIAAELKTDRTKKPRPHEDPHRYARNLAAWITGFTPHKIAPSIAVFDGFGAPEIPDATKTFIEELIKNVQEDEDVSSRLRVLLLGYDTSRLQEKNLNFQSYVLEHVDESHAEVWLRQRYPDQPDFLYEDAVSEIKNNLQISGSMRMRMLCLLVDDLSRQFESA